VPGKEPGRWPGAACKVEFDAFLECGILAHGFLWLRCGDGRIQGVAKQPENVGARP